MATVVKNFRIKSGLIVEGTTGTINNQNILTETGGDAYILNLVGGATLVKSVDTGVFNVDNAGNLTINANTFDAYGAASAAQSAAEDYADGLAVNYDAAGAASAAQSAAEDYADGLAVNYDAAGSATAAAAQALTDAQDYADAQIQDSQTTSTTTWSSYKTSTEIGLAQAAALSDANDYTDTAVTNLVNGAPALLDTLGELATALQENPDIISDLQDIAAGKQGTLTASTGITIDGSNNISVTANTYDAYGAASTAQSNAEDYADGLAVNYDAAGSAAAAQSAAEGTAQAALDDVLDGTTGFTALNINDLSSQRAAQGVIATAQTGSSVMSWSKSDYGTAKAWVKFATATHSQISEVLLTTDSSNNIAITEFGMVGTNGSLGSVGASYLNGNLAIEVDTVHANTTVTVVATLIK
jgi:hypothetical protein